ncbi:unnamed protein product [Citrullus colocynthis]|uniref:Protein kinase domain-containing protein n=1 Tax=Citrullus colocynthis TaxID=252529 RepID=A0ABP0YJN4_9ROSI
MLDFGKNHIEGKLPEGVGALKNLQILNLRSNLISGTVFSVAFHNLTELLVVDLSENSHLLSDILSEIGKLEKLEKLKKLWLYNSGFYGEIPSSHLLLCWNLVSFHVSENKLVGSFPNGFCTGKGIVGKSPDLSLSGRCLNLERFQARLMMFPFPSISMAAQLDNNSFSSKIPRGLGSIRSLYRFSALLNRFYGALPPNICNILTREIPTSVADLPVLNYLDLSDNNLTASFLQGNPDLCGPGLQSPCSQGHPTNHMYGLKQNDMCPRLSSLCFRSSKFSCWVHSSITGKSAQGCGSTKFSQVFILSLPRCELINVKKLVNFGSHSWKSLKAGAKNLAKIRHKNVIKGSLADLICRNDSCLNWNVRLRISIEVAQGLAYINKDNVPHLLHRNAKLSHILLDADFVLKFKDFALHHIVGESPLHSTVASEPSHSCCTASEYKYNKKATEQMDVYSFGAVLRELVTGRQAEHSESTDSPDVVQWVRRKVNIANGASQVLDSSIMEHCQRQMLEALDIALQCTSIMPEKRPSMLEVAKALQLVGLTTNLHDAAFSVAEDSLVSSERPPLAA